MSPSCAEGESWLVMLVRTLCTRDEICSATALQWLSSCDCEASLRLDTPAPCAAAMHCVATAAVCLAVISRRLMAFFLRAFEAAAFTTALQRGRGRKNKGLYGKMQYFSMSNTSESHASHMTITC